MEVRESSRQIREPIDESSETLFVNRRRCCFYFPCFDRSKSSSSSTHAEINETGGSLWNRSVAALMKIREWSEIVAGPRWKTFIRRFNRNRSGNNRKQGNSQYDPLSYAMNFDEGPGGQNSHFDEVDDEFYYGSMNFSSRYAKGSMDLSKEGTSFV
ncbi:hypothetical protein ACJIZ3_009916 [Penstemon smallii]|uniref:Uncharacterized protein n=1 Tax=Penstemon smallii TaxID=265156 RepID=A0ABD3TFD8_9LAMI